MRKFFVFACLFLLIGCSSSKDQLVMVTEAGFAPYEYYENDEIVGVDIEIAKEIANYMGKKLVVKDVYFDSIINELNSGKADMALAGMSITEERLEEVDFSYEYIKSRQVVIVRDGSNINDIRDIYNKKVAVQLGSVADQYFGDKYPNTSLVRQKKYLSMVEDLKANKVDLIVMDELPAKEIVRANNGLKIIDGYVFEDSYGIAVKKGNSELLKAINVVLERLISEGKIDEYVLRFTR